MESKSPTWVRIAALQLDLQVDQLMPNLHLIRSTVEREVQSAPLDIVVLPEVFSGRYEATDGSDERRFLCTLARTCDVHVIGGSFQIKESDGRKFNRCYVVHRSGEEVGHYDKRALFSTEADGREPGMSPGVFNLDGVRVGVLICADVWHPEFARAVQGQIDLLLVPASTSVPSEKYQEYARIIWHALALTRAMENAVAVVVADWPDARQDAQRVFDGVRSQRTQYTSGATTIVDPSHRPNVSRIQRVITKGKPGVLRGDIDLTAIKRYRDYRRSVGLLPD